MEPQHRSKIRAFKFIVPFLLVCVAALLLAQHFHLASYLWALFALILLIHIGNALVFGRRIAFEEIEYHSPRIAKALDGYSIAFVTDTHDISVKDLQRILEEMNKQQLDLVLLGGDYAPGKAMEESLDWLSKVQAKDGLYGVEGNHDCFELLFPSMEERGIAVLSNSGVRLRPGLFLAGVEDLWNRKPNLKLAMEDAAEDDFRLLLSHNPDVAMLQGDEVAFDLMLSGHTHAGQVSFFGLYAPALLAISDYGQRFCKAWCKGEGLGTRDLFVSNGAGSHRWIPRVFARPKVNFLKLHSV